MILVYPYGLPKRAEYDVFESITKYCALKLNEDIIATKYISASQ
jgi:hypothetical protein